MPTRPPEVTTQLDVHPQQGPLPSTPSLILLAGPPLSGKTTLAQALTRALPTALVHVENDALRTHVAHRRHGEAPRFTDEESRATYELAATLARAGLRKGHHVLHDATNLDPENRSLLLESAQQASAPALALIFKTPNQVREERATQLGPKAVNAHRALGTRPLPDPDLPVLSLDGTAGPEENARRVLRENPILLNQGDEVMQDTSAFQSGRYPHTNRS